MTAIRVMLDLIEQAEPPSLGWLARYDQAVMAPSIAELAALLAEQVAPSVDWLVRASAALDYAEQIGRQD